MQLQCRCDFIGGSIFAAAPMFPSEAEGAAESVEKTVLADLTVILPVFFRRRKRRPQQISRSGEQTAAHAHAKHGA
jgi:hypothetical protein